MSTSISSDKYSGPASLSFPLKLMKILDTKDLSDIVSWLPNGRGFTIHDKKRFASEILPEHFKVAQFASFTRRMKRWRFTLQKLGNHQSNYFHPLFVRGEVSKCLGMRPKPQKVKGRKPNPPKRQLKPHDSTSACWGKESPPLFYSGSASNTRNAQSSGPNRNLLRIPLPPPETRQRPVVNSATQYYHSLPPSRESFPHNNYLHAPLFEDQSRPHAHSTAGGGVLWGPYDRKSLPPPMHQQIRGHPFFGTSHDEALAESYAQREAYLARQMKLSRLPFMTIRRGSSSNVVPV